MPTFTSLDQVKDPKKYGEALKKAALVVKPEEPRNFILFASFDFGKEKKPLLLIDYQANMVASLPGRPTPKAKGEVVRNAKNELQFSNAGKGVCQELQTFLTKHLLQDTVCIPADEGDGATPPAAAVNAPAKAASTPAPGKFPVPQRAGGPARVAAVTPKPGGTAAPAGGTTPVQPAAAPVRANSGSIPAKPQAASPASPNPAFKRAAMPNTAAAPATPAGPTRPAGTPPTAGVGIARTRATPPPAGAAATPPRNAAGPQAASVPHAAPGPQAAAAPHPAGAPQAAAAPHGAAAPAPTLAERKTKCQSQFNFLKAQTWPNIPDAEKAKVLNDLATDLAQCDDSDIATVEKDLRTELNKKLDPAAPRWTSIAGVDQFFLVPAQRKDQELKLSEELRALTSLAASKSPGHPVIKEMGDLLGKLTAFNTAVTGCVDPAEMKVLFGEFKDLQQERLDLGKKVRPLWIEDQKARFRDELEKAKAAGKQSSSGPMILALGDEAFMEMARMSETMVVNANEAAKRENAAAAARAKAAVAKGAKADKEKPKKEDFDPYKKDPAGGPSEPLEMGEVASIYGYSTQDFTSINAILRGSKINPAEDTTLPAGDTKTDFRPYIAACTSALKKLPVYKGTVRRCDKSLPDVVVKELLTSGSRSDKAFVSTGLKTVPGFGEIVSIITDIKTGREISMFSLHGTEGEILFPPGSVFKFVKFADKEPADGDSVKPKEITDIKKLTFDQLKNLKKGVFYFTQKA